MSEMELSLLRQRSFEALQQKARRGELFLTVAVGYVKVRHDRIEIDPDLRVREAIAMVFRKTVRIQEHDVPLAQKVYFVYRVSILCNINRAKVFDIDVILGWKNS